MQYLLSSYFLIPQVNYHCRKRIRTSLWKFHHAEKTALTVWSVCSQTEGSDSWLKIHGFCDLGCEKYFILIFTDLSLKIQFSFNDKCRPQTMVVLGVPVTLSPVEMKDAFLLHYSYRYFGNIICPYHTSNLGQLLDLVV